ncbi:hypothetical protein BRAS3843_2920020 [Bradyrhizobium sp. STM 3843]|nr:hypothetical protein BRAS3843_2920020 [Bradyrhizobium sp. STM 3843]
MRQSDVVTTAKALETLAKFGSADNGAGGPVTSCHEISVEGNASNERMLDPGAPGLMGCEEPKRSRQAFQDISF